MEKTRWVATECYVPGPQAIKVCQVIGEGETQKTLERHVCLPAPKPAIEQIVDVFARQLCLTDVEVLTDKVIVRGHLAIKVLYVACRPAQPVHAVEIRPVRFTADIPICGARCGMYADASAAVEYVDYQCTHHYRPHRYKEHGHEQSCPPCECECCREFDVFVVLQIVARVISDREIVVYPWYPGMPLTPKG